MEPFSVFQLIILVQIVCCHLVCFQLESSDRPPIHKLVNFVEHQAAKETYLLDSRSHLELMFPLLW